MKGNCFLLAVLAALLLCGSALARQSKNLTTTIPLAHFRLTYDRTIADDDAQRIAKNLQRSYEAIAKRLSFSPVKHFPVYLYSSVEKVRRVLRYKVFDDAYFDEGKITLVLPGLQTEGRVLDAVIDRVVARAFVGEIIRCPAWVAEVYSIAAGYDFTRCGSPTRTTIANFSDLGEDLSRADNPDAMKAVFANLSATAKFLAERYGDTKLDLLIGQFRAAKPVEEAFENAFSDKYSVTERAWAEYIQAQPHD
jgi:hypothetical protein